MLWIEPFLTIDFIRVLIMKGNFETNFRVEKFAPVVIIFTIIVFTVDIFTVIVRCICATIRSLTFTRRKKQYDTVVDLRTTGYPSFMTQKKYPPMETTNSSSRLL